jgi:hypothetical protein
MAMVIWSRRAILLGGAGYLIAACTMGRSGDALYHVGVNGEGNQLLIAADPHGEAGDYVVTLQSARGIGQASVAWWGANSPHQLRFQLKLTGLEHFGLIWVNRTQKVSVNVSANLDNPTTLESVQHGSAETQIEPDSPYWLAVSLPAQGDGFELTAPRAFLADAPRLWAVTWIDFYR